jgi:hypothetical protein
MIITSSFESYLQEAPIKPAPISYISNKTCTFKLQYHISTLISISFFPEMGRSPCCDEKGLKKGPWTPEEDQKLTDYISSHGHGSWKALPNHAGLNRCGKSCRLRWTNYLKPDIKRGKFSEDEERKIINLHSVLGNKYV